MQKVEPGGTLAVQMPRNFTAPSHLLIAETALNGPWRSKVEHLVTPPPVGPPAFYHQLLAPLSEAIDIWETEYLQVLQGENRSRNGPRAPGSRAIWMSCKAKRGPRSRQPMASGWRTPTRRIPPDRRYFPSRHSLAGQRHRSLSTGRRSANWL